MASATAELESALRTSLWSLLHHTTLGLDSSLDVAGGVASILSLVHRTLADFSCQSNRTRTTVLWNRLPDELKLETARWLPDADRTNMLGVSCDVRKLLLSDTSLWTTISLPRRRVPNADRDEFAEFLQTVVVRSGSRPLDLEWAWIGVGQPPFADRVRDVILSALPRTRTLVLCSSFFRDGPQMFWTTPAPLLVRLTISDGYNTCFTFEPSASVKEAPLLRELTINGSSTFKTSPTEPFLSVQRFETTMSFNSGTSGWEHLWKWFPSLETLVLHVDEQSHAVPVALPSPPDSLRHVILHDHKSFQSSERVVREWSTHTVQRLEIFSSAKPALCNAVDFLERCDPAGLQSVSFTHVCCPVDKKYVTVLRGSSVTVVIWTNEVWDHGPQIELARARGTLANRVQTLVASWTSVPAMFSNRPTFPKLRSLTVARTHGFIESLGPFSLPALERLTMDLSFDSRPDVQLGAVAGFLACIENAQHLRDITIRLPAVFDPQSPALEKAIADITTAERRIRTEFSSRRSRHMDPCVHYRPQST